MDDWLKTWKLDERQVRDRMYRAPTARERERWARVIPAMNIQPTGARP